MSTGNPSSDAISIRDVRQHAAMVVRGFFFIAFLPLFVLLPMLFDIFRGLPRVDLGVLSQPLFWLLRPASLVGWLNTSGRLEEGISQEIQPFGPFVGIGAPDEPLPELGAARSYFGNETWQTAIKTWVDMARLIIKVAGPTKWIRWELNTIREQGGLAKLIVLFPAGSRSEREARWQNILTCLEATEWHRAFQALDANNTIAIRFLDGGRIASVTGGKRRLLDYLLALRLMLYGMRERFSPVPGASGH